MAIRQISTEIWNDDKFIEMDLETRFLWLYLLTCPKSKGCGIYKFDMRYVQMETGLAKSTIEQGIATLYEMKCIGFDKDTNEISIYNYAIYNIRNFGKPIQDMLNKELSQIKSKSLLRVTYCQLVDYASKFDPTKKQMWNSILNTYLQYLSNEDDYGMLEDILKEI